MPSPASWSRGQQTGWRRSWCPWCRAAAVGEQGATWRRGGSDHAVVPVASFSSCSRQARSWSAKERRRWMAASSGATSGLSATASDARAACCSALPSCVHRVKEVARPAKPCRQDRDGPCQWTDQPGSAPDIGRRSRSLPPPTWWGSGTNPRPPLWVPGPRHRSLAAGLTLGEIAFVRLHDRIGPRIQSPRHRCRRRMIPQPRIPGPRPWCCRESTACTTAGGPVHQVGQQSIGVGTKRGPRMRPGPLREVHRRKVSLARQATTAAPGTARGRERAPRGRARSLGMLVGMAVRATGRWAGAGAGPRRPRPAAVGWERIERRCCPKGPRRTRPDLLARGGPDVLQGGGAAAPALVPGGAWPRSVARRIGHRGGGRYRGAAFPWVR